MAVISEGAGQAAKGLSMPCREKYWEEMSDAQKIEKLSGIVVVQSSRIAELISAVEDLSQPHSHLDGKMVREIVHSGMWGQLNQGDREWNHSRDILNRDPERGPKLRC